MEGYIWLLFEIQSFACGQTGGWIDGRVLWLIKIIQTTYLKNYNTSLYTTEMTGAVAKRSISSYKEHILEHF